VRSLNEPAPLSFVDFKSRQLICGCMRLPHVWACSSLFLRLDSASETFTHLPPGAGCRC
jgi:hypothetical protein